MYLLKNLAIGFAFLQFVQAIQIYVTNTEYECSNATCVLDGMTLYPCEKMADIARKIQLNIFNATNIIITLLPGDYYIHNSVNFRFYSMSEVYFNSWKNQGQVRIICDGGDFSLGYSSVDIVSISHVDISRCGNVAPTIAILVASMITVNHLNITNSSQGFVEVSGIMGNMSISHCIFQGSTKSNRINIISGYAQNVLDTLPGSHTFGLHPRNVEYIIVFEKCIFAHNKAGNNITGGAVAIVEHSTQTVSNNSVIITHCHFMSNSADAGGAVIITNFTYIEIINSNFTDNFAYNNGGAIKVEGASLSEMNFTIANCTFTSNNAQKGGGVYIETGIWSKTLHVMVNSKFSNNSAAVCGGTIMIGKVRQTSLRQIIPTHAIFMTNVTLENNFAEIGGALFFNYTNNITITNCSLQNNSANQASNISEGGAVAIKADDFSYVIINKTMFISNNANITIN